MNKDEKVVATEKIKKAIIAKKEKAVEEKKVAKTAKGITNPTVKATRSGNYNKTLASVDRLKFYTIDEAIKLAKETSYVKFDASIDLQVKILPLKKSDKVAVRGTVKLPSGATKTKKIVVASEEMLLELEKGKMNFDMLLATPEMMPKLAKYAKTLGPKGLMPSPKSGTVTSDPSETLKELQTGLIEYKSDAHGIVHCSVGKKSWSDEKIKDNIETMLRVLPLKQMQSITLSTTMGPGVKVKNT